MTPSPRPAAYAPGRIVLTIVIVLALMALGLVAGNWQWGRYETRAAAAAAQERASGTPVVELSSIVSPTQDDAGDAAWRTVTVSGRIDSASLTVLRGRPISDGATLQYLVWLDTDDGHSVIVNLGWQPRDLDAAPVLPAGDVTVTGMVRDLEQDNGKQGTRISQAQLPAPGGAALPVYVMAERTCTVGNECVEGLEQVPTPVLSLGPHLSYAMQWWLLTVAAGPVAIWLTRREARLEGERAAEGGTPSDAGRTPGGTERARARRKPRGPSDEEIEDAL